MSVSAPERSRGAHRRDARRTVAEPPQFGFTAPQPPLRTRVNRQQSRRRRFIRRALVSYLVLLVLVAGGMWAWRHQRSQPTKPVQAPPHAHAAALVAWSVRAGDRSFVAVVALSPVRPPIALAIPGDTIVDLPGGGPSTVGAGQQTPGALVASMQAVFGRRIQHYLVSTSADFVGLIDRVGGVQVLVEEPFTWNGQVFGPGETVLSGGAAEEYLVTASPEDATGRWEDVLAGVLAGTASPSLTAAPLGATDDPSLVPTLLSLAHGVAVVELPTSPAEGGGLQVDAKALRDLTLRRFPGIGGKLVRIVVLNGNGRPGVGWEIAQVLAPNGFRVVASQNLPTFNSDETQVIASTTELFGSASQVRSLLGFGKVYVGPQPTGIADITIVVGKDYAAA